MRAGFERAEKLLDSGSPDANAISRLEMILSADTDAMEMIRMHREYGNRLPVVLEMIAGIRKNALLFGLLSLCRLMRKNLLSL